VIALRIGGTIVRALVDTGAVQSLVDPRLVKQLGLREEERSWIVGIGTEPRQVGSVTITGAAIGPLFVDAFQRRNSGSNKPTDRYPSDTWH
jgi:hypothetical protein